MSDVDDADFWDFRHDESPTFSDDEYAPQYRQDVVLPIFGEPLRVIEDQRLGIAGHAWPGGRALLSFVAAHLDILRCQRILELGAGTGLLGIGCDLLLQRASSSAEHTVFVTDVGEAVPLMEQNVQLNGASRTTAAELVWGRTDVLQFGAPLDVVIMAEVAYIKENFSDLAATLASLCGPKTVVIHGYRLREACGSPLFFDELTKFGFVHEELERTADATIFQHHPPQKAQIVRDVGEQMP